MSQRRLEHYFIPPRAQLAPSGRDFTDLPYSVRELVYKYAGLDDILVDLNYTNLKVYPKGTYPETGDCRKLKADAFDYRLRKLDTFGLGEAWEIKNSSEDFASYGTSLWNRRWGSHQSMFLVSRQIHEEVEAFTYAGGVFRVCLGQPLGFTRLWHMSENALSNLGSLTIRLDIPKTIVFDPGWSDMITPPKHIDLSTRAGKMVLKNWKMTIERLVQSVRPGQLRLRVVFRAKTTSDAMTLLKPLLRLPLLKDCGICMEVNRQRCWWKDEVNHDRGYSYHRTTSIKADEIFQFAQQIIRELTPPAQDQHLPRFRILDLPKELRLAIFEHTDLVPPHAVQWRPRERIRTSPSCKYCNTGYRTRDDDDRSVCWCHHYPDGDIEDRKCCNNCSPGDHSGICYCCRVSSPAWSSSCTCCPRLRSSLFFVSRQIRQEATLVYYSYNEILVMPYNSATAGDMVEPYYGCKWPIIGIHFMPEVELSIYLSSIARNALQHIRWLEWLLPTSQRAYLLPETPAWLSYLNTLLLMETQMNLTALTLTINLSASGMFVEYYPNMCMPLNREAFRWYETITLPFKQLGKAGLKNFFVHLQSYNIEKLERINHEQNLERAVMGRGYDSAKRGKPVERMREFCDKVRKIQWEERERAQREWDERHGQV